MGFILKNPNPKQLNVGDCSIRAISIATDKDWNDTYTAVTLQGLLLSDMPSSNRVFGDYLETQGFKLHLIPDSCPECYTIRDFCKEFPIGRYVVGAKDHVVAVVDGSYLDTYDSGDYRPLYFWRKEEKADE